MMRRASETILSSKWWLNTLQIEDGSGDAGDPSSWEYRVYFDPSGAGDMRLGDHLAEEEAAKAKRELARQRYKARQYSDDLYRGTGTVPLTAGGPTRPQIVPVNTIFEEEHPGQPAFAPDDVLSSVPTAADLRRQKRKEAGRNQRLKSYGAGSSFTGTDYS